MATVTINQAVNMLSLPTSDTLGSTTNGATSFKVFDSGNTTHFMAFAGTFSYGAMFVDANATSASFNFDADFIPNISVSNIDFHFDYTYTFDTIRTGNFDKVLQDILVGDDKVTGTSDSDTLTGFAGADRVFGLGGGDDLVGDIGADRLFGGGGIDTLYGGGDGDTLVGGAAPDSMTGNAGADTFLFQSIKDAPKSGMIHDTIEDFVRTDGDRIDLSQIDARLLRAGNQSFEFIGAANFTGNAGDPQHRGELRAVATADGFTLLGDVTGDRIADFVIDVATNVLAFKAHDFAL